MDWIIPKKIYLCPWNRGCLPDYVLQSTPVSNKTRNLDKSQPFSVIISIIESTKIRKIQLVRGIPPFYGQTEDSGSTNISNKTQTNQFQLGKYSYRNNGNALNTLTLSLGNTYFCNWALNIAF